jgi:hypothetical protein
MIVIKDTSDLVGHFVVCLHCGLNYVDNVVDVQ